MVETMQTSKKEGHFNESIVNEEILEDMKKNRIASYEVSSGYGAVGRI